MKSVDAKDTTVAVDGMGLDLSPLRSLGQMSKPLHLLSTRHRDVPLVSSHPPSRLSCAGLTWINMIACSGYPDCMRVDMASTCIDIALAFVLP